MPCALFSIYWTANLQLKKYESVSYINAPTYKICKKICDLISTWNWLILGQNCPHNNAKLICIDVKSLFTSIQWLKLLIRYIQFSQPKRFCKGKIDCNIKWMFKSKVFLFL